VKQLLLLFVDPIIRVLKLIFQGKETPVKVIKKSFDHTPEYCDTIIKGVTDSQNALHKSLQADITNINTALQKGSESFVKNDLEHKELFKFFEKFRNQVLEDNKKTRTTMYVGAIAGLILFIGCQGSIVFFIFSVLWKLKSGG